MKWNISNCSVITFGQLHNAHYFQYTLDGQPLERVFLWRTWLSPSQLIYPLMYVLMACEEELIGVHYQIYSIWLVCLFFKTFQPTASLVWSPYHLGPDLKLYSRYCWGWWQCERDCNETLTRKQGNKKTLTASQQFYILLPYL